MFFLDGSLVPACRGVPHMPCTLPRFCRGCQQHPAVMNGPRHLSASLRAYSAGEARSNEMEVVGIPGTQHNDNQVWP